MGRGPCCPTFAIGLLQVKRGMELGLERVFAAHQALISTPYDATVLHVAGSNGKGTLCATIAAHLKYLGHSTVLFTSPHLIRVEERVRVDGRPIDAHRFDGFLAEIQGIETQLGIELTFLKSPSSLLAFVHRETMPTTSS